MHWFDLTPLPATHFRPTFVAENSEDIEALLLARGPMSARDVAALANERTINRIRPILERMAKARRVTKRVDERGLVIYACVTASSERPADYC